MNEIFVMLKLFYCEGCNYRNMILNIKEFNVYILFESFSKFYFYFIEGVCWNVVKLINNLIDCVVMLYFKYIFYCLR